MIEPVTIKDDELQGFIDSADWCIQQKFDGERRYIRCQGGQDIECVSRNGLEKQLPVEIEEALPRDMYYELDCELAWGILWVFDDCSMPSSPYVKRLTRVCEIVNAINRPDIIRKVPTMRKPAAKQQFYDRCRSANVEGVIFRKLDGIVDVGSQKHLCVRYKFCKRCEVVVMDATTGVKSVQVGMFDNEGVLSPVCGVSIAGKRRYPYLWDKIKEAGVDNLVFEVQYLYVTDEGQLFQPRFIRIRDDKLPNAADCNVSQLEGMQPHCGAVELGKAVDEPLETAESRLAAKQAVYDAKQDAKNVALADRRKGDGRDTWYWVVVALSACVIFLLKFMDACQTGGRRGGSGGGGRSRGGGGGGNSGWGNNDGDNY